VVVGCRESPKDGGLIGRLHRFWIASSLALLAMTKTIPEVTSMLKLAMIKQSL
jgi:hypothetical protein